MTVHIGADHRGFEYKEKLIPFLEDQGYSVEDCSTETYDESDDYPDISFCLADRVVAAGKDAKGILICDSGVGVCIAANKVPGIRAVQAWDEQIIRRSREHNDANVICISQDHMSLDDAKRQIHVFLQTEFSGEERHERRVQKIIKKEKEC